MKHTLFKDEKTGLEITRELAAKPLLDGTKLISWGCHGAGINNLMLPSNSINTISTNYYGYPQSKEGMLAYVQGVGIINDEKLIPWDTPYQAYSAMTDFLAKKASIESASEYAEECYKLTAKYLTSLSKSIFNFNCVINYGKESRGNQEGYQTYRFVEWLIKNKMGHMSASPVVVNPLHNGKSGSNALSYVQSFTWIPCAHPDYFPIKGTAFSRMLDPKLKMLEEKDEAVKRVGKVGELFHKFKQLISE